MQIVNLTPHKLVLRGSEDYVYESQGRAVLKQTPGQLVEVPGIPVPVAEPAQGGTVEGLPEPLEGTVYVVAYPVATFVKRPDVLSPGTSPQDGAIRNSEGQIEAVTRLIRHA